MLRHVHYEAAFEDFLRQRGWSYLPVDERRRAMFLGSRIKSFDFLVYPPSRRAWLVDIKGRQFPYAVKKGRRFWENWVTRDDLEGLDRWQGAFGPDFEPGLVFAYWLRETCDREPPGGVHSFNGRTYSFLWVSATAYAAAARMRSPKWNTVTVSTRVFRDLVQWIPENDLAETKCADSVL